MRRLTFTFPTILLAGAAIVLRAQSGASPVLDAMKAELGRSQEKLKSQPVAPYFMSYEITETHSFNVRLRPE
jgi:hypothetical protein